MPTTTPVYGLTAFLNGDVYSASADQNRFVIIDNQMSFLSEVISDGVISGWSISDQSQSDSVIISVSTGMGIVNRHVVRTFCDIDIPLTSSAQTYVYLRRKTGKPFTFGNFSSAVSLIFSDSEAPDAPSGLKYTSTYNSVSLQWTANIEPDFSYYMIFRSAGLAFEKIGESLTENYIDIEVNQDSTYTYQVQAVDLSGNISPFSSIGVIIPKDLTIPMDPVDVFIFSRSDCIQLFWKLSLSTNVIGYRIEVQELDEERLPIGSITETDLPDTDMKCFVSGLEPNKFYRIIIKSININGVLSPGVVFESGFVDNPASTEIGSDISVNDILSDINPNGIALQINWEDSIESNETIPTGYAITIIENAVIESDPIIIPYDDRFLTDSAHNSILGAYKVIEVFEVNGDSRAIKSRTYYTIKVQAIDVDSIWSTGAVDHLVTANFLSPSRPRDLSASLINYSIVFSWANSYDYFDHNLIKLTDKDNATGEVVTIEDNVNIYKDKTYIIDKEDVEANHIYTLSIRAIDEYANASEWALVSYSTDVSYTQPDCPRGLHGFSGSGFVTIKWDAPQGIEIQSYRLWRCNKSNSIYTPANWSLVATLSSDLLNFVDYGVENGNSYYYVVSVIDIYNQESTIPTESDWVPRIFAKATAVVDSYLLSDPLSVSVSFVPNDHDATISWESEIGQFDGYEIYRSSSENVNWIKVGCAQKTSSDFVDEDGLLKDGVTYSYMVRKIVNEAEIFISSSSVIPFNSICLGTIVFDNQGYIQEIDQTCRLYIINLISRIDNYMDLWLDTHRHNFVSSTLDKRIDLNRNISVTSWVTSDNRNFITTEPISGATSYDAIINGERTDILYSVDQDGRQITFERDLDSGAEIELICVGLNEISGILPSKRLGDISATSMESGLIPKEQLSDIDHFGRRKELLIPLQFPMVSSNNYEYDIQQNNILTEDRVESIGDGVTFYDIEEISAISSSGTSANISSGTNSSISPRHLDLVAATSYGIMVTSDGGITWSKVLQGDSPIHTIYFSESQVRFFSLSSSSVYVSEDGSNWARTTGLETVHFVRDITEDENANIFVSTDAGIFIMPEPDTDSASPGFVDLIFTQVQPYGELISDSYAIWYDSGISVSTYGKIFVTTDIGASWTKYQELEEKTPFRSVCQYGEYYFAVSDTCIFRKDSGSSGTEEFIRIATLPTYMSRKIIVFEDRILVTTDDGILLSDQTDNIYSDTNLNMERSVPDVSYENRPIIVTSMNEIGNLLFVGSEGRLFSCSSLNHFNRIYNDSGIIPSVYVDVIEKKLGFFYDSYRGVVVFDEKIDTSSIVTVANQYRTFRATGRSWLGEKYDSPVQVYVNNSAFLATKALAAVPSAVLSTPNFPDFEEPDANASRADAYVSEYLVSVADLTDPLTNKYIAVNNLVHLYRKVYSQVVGKVRFGVTLSLPYKTYTNYVVKDMEIAPFDIYDTIFKQYEIVPEIGSIDLGSTAPDSYIVDVSSGVFTFSKEFKKQDVLTIDLPGTDILTGGLKSHEQLDDGIEYVNSGLPAVLADVQQSNMVKLDMVIVRENIADLNASDGVDLTSQYQTECLDFSDLVPFSGSLIESSWYDKLNSTVEYTSEYSNNPLESPRTYAYPLSVAYDSNNTIYVGFPDALISVNKTSFDISVVDYNFRGGKGPVNDLLFYNGNLYLISEKDIYVMDGEGVWSNFTSEGLSGIFRKITHSGISFVLITSEGYFYYDISRSLWSLGASITNGFFIDDFDYSFSLSGDNLYYSVDGVSWSLRGNFGNMVVNAFDKYRTNFVIASGSGLRMDNSTFYEGSSSSISTTLIDLESNLEESGSISFNCVKVHPDGNSFVAGAQDGSYWTYDGLVYDEHLDSGLKAIHKILYVDGGYWLFGYNLLKVPSQSDAIDLSGGELF